MGGDYYDRNVQQADNNQQYSQQAEQLFAQQSQKFKDKDKTVHKSLDPHQYQVQNLVCQHKHPIVFALDITGSMGDWPKIIYDKMPMFYGQIMMQGYLTDPAISICGIGDSTTDDSCLQIIPFNQGKQIDEQLSKMFIYASGGGNEHESYEVAAYFYNNCTTINEAELPFLFITGDEMYFDNLSSSTIEKVIGKQEIQGQINSFQLFKSLLTKYNTFFLHKQYFDQKKDLQIKQQWVNVLGAERVIDIFTPKACIDTILGVIAIVSGARNLETYIKDMQVRGQEQQRIKEVNTSLELVSQTFSQKKFVVFGMKYQQEKNKQIQLEEVKKQDELIENEMQMKQIREKILPQLMKKNSEDKSLLELQKQNEIIKQLFHSKVPKEFLCPITCEMFIDPVFTEDGVTYERGAIEYWLQNHSTSPLTNQQLKSKALTPNLSMKKLIAEFYAQVQGQNKR